MPLARGIKGYCDKIRDSLCSQVNDYCTDGFSITAMRLSSFITYLCRFSGLVTGERNTMGVIIPQWVLTVDPLALCCPEVQHRRTQLCCGCGSDTGALRRI